ncbi:putative protocadherin-23 [Triplophysa rosa]|uniref:Protocadherin-23 n=1 Tax=Triplophysa rosa TaxID=992332 RepID=A0A9W7WJR8_TRIRA|nr:putative protocadherin-23 [Triplophysa rosa]
MSRAVVDSMLKTSSGKPHTYSLKLGLRVKQRLWKTLNCPTMLEEEQPDGLIRVKEMFSRPSLKRSAPRINVDISGEPLPYAAQRKRTCL